MDPNSIVSINDDLQAEFSDFVQIDVNHTMLLIFLYNIHALKLVWRTFTYPLDGPVEPTPTPPGRIRVFPLLFTPAGWGLFVPFIHSVRYLRKYAVYVRYNGVVSRSGLLIFAIIFDENLIHWRFNGCPTFVLFTLCLVTSKWLMKTNQERGKFKSRNGTNVQCCPINNNWLEPNR